MDFPGGTVDMNLPTNAGDMVQSLVWQDPTEQLCHKSPCSKVLERQLLKCAGRTTRVPQQERHHNQEPTHHNTEKLPIATTREKPLKKEAVKMQHKNKHNIFN